MRRFACIPVLLAAIAAGAGCTSIGSGGSGPGRHRIDELAGSYRGVALGDPLSAAIRVFGQPGATDGPAYPIGVSFSTGGPLFEKNAPGYDREPDLLRYDGVAFLSTPTPAGIHSIVVADPRAATQRGVGIGDSLSKAKREYPTLHCHKAQNTFESPSPAHCSGRLAKNRYIWFGNDPIRVIALAPTPMG